MISQLTLGKPFETEAVINFPSDGMIINDEKFFPFGDFNLDEGFRWDFKLFSDDKIFGLGESMGGINKRGHVYKSWCNDDPFHTEEKESLYGAHNFIIVHSPAVSLTFGLFIDYPGEVTFDCAWTNYDTLTITCAQPDLKIYLITPDQNNEADENYSLLKDVVHQFRKIIGKSYFPPMWTFGYMQSRWGYGSEKDLIEVCENYEKCGIPLDAIFLDIDYMKNFRDFTVNEEAFPDLKKSIKSLAKKNVHVVPIIDAGIKAGDDDPVDVEGREKDYFCKKADGSVFQGAVWPGLAHFPDFMRPEVRKWFGEQYKVLTDAGIDGFWNDMNEPAIFYSDTGLKETYDAIEDVINGKNKDAHPTWTIKDLICKVQNNIKDYSSFYHQIPEEMAGNFAESVENGIAKVPHNKIHNLYGYNMTRSASEFLAKKCKKGSFLISRASYIGMHRYSGIWTGDNASWWSHILLCLKQLPALSMSGFLYSGCDLGGFGCNTNRELLIRFLQLGVFTPLMRNHAALGTRNQEVYQFENTDDFKAIICTRYRLIPYLYEVFGNAIENSEMYFKPLCFDFPNDKIALQTEDQLLLGDSIMIAPVYEPNARGRTVYLPENMTKVTCRIGCGAEFGEPELEKLEEGLHFINYGLDEVVFFIRNDKKIYMVDSKKTTSELELDKKDYIG